MLPRERAIQAVTKADQILSPVGANRIGSLKPEDRLYAMKGFMSKQSEALEPDLLEGVG